MRRARAGCLACYRKTREDAETVVWETVGRGADSDRSRLDPTRIVTHLPICSPYYPELSSEGKTSIKGVMDQVLAAAGKDQSLTSLGIGDELLARHRSHPHVMAILSFPGKSMRHGKVGAQWEGDGARRAVAELASHHAGGGAPREGGDGAVRWRAVAELASHRAGGGAPREGGGTAHRRGTAVRSADTRWRSSLAIVLTAAHREKAAALLIARGGGVASDMGTWGHKRPPRLRVLTSAPPSHRPHRC